MNNIMPRAVNLFSGSHYQSKCVESGSEEMVNMVNVYSLYGFFHTFGKLIAFFVFV